jgi:hypothetical protein
MVSEVAAGTYTLTALEAVIDSGMPYTGALFYGGYVDLTNLVSGDTVVIKVYVKIKLTGNFILDYSQSFSGVQPNTLIKFPMLPNKNGYKITAQQTAQGAGGLKNIDWETFSA